MVSSSRTTNSTESASSISSRSPTNGPKSPPPSSGPARTRPASYRSRIWFRSRTVRIHWRYARYESTIGITSSGRPAGLVVQTIAARMPRAVFPAQCRTLIADDGRNTARNGLRSTIEITRATRFALITK
jgi:hypothetical protein